MTAAIALASKANSRDLYSPTVDIRRANCLGIRGLKSLPDNSVGLFVNDLPYGKLKKAVDWDTCLDLEEMWKELHRVGTPDCVFLFTAQNPFTAELVMSNKRDFRYSLVWEKSSGTSPLQARNAPMNVHEDILVFCRKRPRYNPQMVEGKPYKAPRGTRTGGQACGMVGMPLTGKDNPGQRFPRSVQYVSWERGWHPTQKPVALMTWLIRTYSDIGHTVCDLTMGSGTTGVAAVREQRNFIGWELGQEYFAIAHKRIKAAQAGKPEPPTPSQQRRAQATAAKRQTLSNGRGFGRKGVR